MKKNEKQLLLLIRNLAERMIIFEETGASASDKKGLRDNLKAVIKDFERVRS